jgi:coenzyme PQQ synthesis protein D (PqqD)
MRAAEGVIVKAVGEELLLLDAARGVYQGLDAVGARVWQLMTSGSSLEEAIEVILDEYEVGREQLRKDVEELLDELRKYGLLV